MTSRGDRSPPNKFGPPKDNDTTVVDISVSMSDGLALPALGRSEELLGQAWRAPSSTTPCLRELGIRDKINTAMFMRQIYDRFQSPYVGIWLFWRPSLVINCPEIGRNVLVKDSAVFRDRYLSGAPHDSLGHFNIFTAKDPLWTNVRRRLTSAFTSSKLKGIQLLLNTKGKELVQRIAEESKKGLFNCRTIYTDFTTDVIGIASLGVNSDSTLTGTSPIREVTKDFQKYSFLRGLAWSCIFFFPELVGPLRLTFYPKDAANYFRKVYKAVAKLREAEHNEDAEPRDLLDILLKMKRSMVLEKEEVTDEILISQAAIFIQAGYETSGSQLSFATYELAHHPEIQEKLYKELRQAKESIGDADFDEVMLAGLTYLNCVIKETMRKYQPMGWLDRVSAQEYKIDEKLTIPAGTPVYVNAIGMHYDPDYFPEPTRFNPDRFLPENEIDIKKFTFMPFGEGPRKCIGLRFGYASVRTGLSSIVLNYELRPVANTPKPNEVQFEKNGVFLTPGEALYVEFVPRK